MSMFIQTSLLGSSMKRDRAGRLSQGDPCKLPGAGSLASLSCSMHGIGRVSNAHYQLKHFDPGQSTSEHVLGGGTGGFDLLTLICCTSRDVLE